MILTFIFLELFWSICEADVSLELYYLYLIRLDVIISSLFKLCYRFYIRWADFTKVLLIPLGVSIF